MTNEELKRSAEERRKKKGDSNLTNEELRERADRVRKYRSVDTSNVNQDYINSFVNDSKAFFSKGKGEDIYNKDTYTTAQDLSSRADVVGAWLYNNKKNIPEQTYKGVNELIDALYTTNNDFTKQWATADDYTKWFNDRAASIEEYNNNLNYDLEGAKKSLDYFQSNLNGYKDAERQIAELEAKNKTLEFSKNKGFADAARQIEENNKRIAVLRSAIEQGNATFGSREDLEKAYSNLYQKYTIAERVQNAHKLSSVGDASSEYYDPEFSKYTAETNSEMEDVINNLSRGDLSGDEITLMALLNDDEKAVFNYYYNKYGLDQATEYLRAIEEELLYRKGERIYEDWLEDRPFMESIFAVAAGLDQFASGIEGIFAQGYTPISATQVAGSLAREDLADVGPEFLGSSTGQIFYDVLNTTSNMLPSVLASIGVTAATGGNAAAGAWVGSALIGASAGGNAKVEMLNRGYTKEQANAYGIMVGASEMLLEKVLGGIPGLKGKGIGDALGSLALQKIDNALARAAITIGGNMLDEALEEGIQTVLEPWLESVVTGADFEAPDIDEVLYSSLLGALSSIGFTAGDIATDYGISQYNKGIVTKSLGQDILDFGNKDALMELAKQMADNKAVTRAATKVEKNASAKNVGKLSQSLVKEITKNQADLESDLMKEGLTREEARLVAKYSMGEDLSEAEEKKVESNEKYIDAVNKVFAKKNKTLTTEAKSEIIESEATANESNAEAESIRVRDGGERLGSENTERPILQMERGTGPYSQWRKALGTKPRDSQAFKLRDQGREVAVASLGVSKGSKIHTVRLLDNIDIENESESMKKGREYAEKNGLILKYFVGGNLVIEEDIEANEGKADEDKTYFEANGYTNGKVMLVRADHHKFTADQIVRHELTHNRIDNGEINVEAAKENLIERLGGKEVYDEVFKFYQKAYAGSNYKDDQILVEMICDSMGDMNIFGYGKESAELMSLVIPEVQKAVNETSKEANQTRGSPESAPSTNEANREIQARVLAKEIIASIPKEVKKAIGFDYSEQLLVEYLKSDDKDQVIFDINTAVRYHPTNDFKRRAKKLIERIEALDKPEGKASRELDTKYLTAVENGDMETAQRMVDEAAKEVGYKEHLYHGTNADFTKFDLRKHGGRNGKGEGYGIYLAANREISAPYGKNVIDSYVKFNRLAEGRKKTLSYNEVKSLVKRSCEIEAQRMVDDEEYDSVSEALRDTWVSNIVYTYDYSNISQVYADVANKLWKENDNDGDLINEIMALSGAHYDYNNALDFYDNILTPITGIDGFHYIWGNKDGSGEQNDIYLAFRSEQIKSADPVTYDDDGNVIPLSERFNEKNEDIRFSRELDVITHMDAVAIAEGREIYEGKAPTDRERLANALESITENDIEKKKLEEYKANIEKMNAETEKLAQFKAEIKELTFGKGKKDPQRLKELKAEATKTENRINTYDKMLLDLEASSVLKGVLMREKQKAYQKAAEKGREALHKNVVGRNKTVMRHKIQDVAHRLDKLLNNATKERNVKKGQSELVRRVLDLTDLLFASDDDLLMNGIETEVTDAELDAINKYTALYNEYHSYDDAVTENKERRKELRSEMNEVKKAFEGVLERERKRISKAKSTDVFNALIREYEKIAQSEDVYIAHAFDQETKKYLEGLRDAVGDTLVKDMTLDQLEMVYKAFRMIETMVSKSNKMFNESLKATAEELGSKTLNEVLAHKRKTEFTQLGKAYSELSWNNLKPIYLMERIGSKTLQMLFDNVLSAESDWAKYEAEARKYSDEMKEKYGFKNWDFKKKWKFTTKTGLEFELDLGQIFTIYAYAQRGEQALNHLRVDGFVFDKLKVIKKNKLGIPIEYELNDKTAYKLDDDNLFKIVGNPFTGEKGILTEDQINYVVAMQKYLSEVLGKRGNEVSEQMYGIDLFNEENYLSIRSEGAYMERVREQAQGTPKIKNRAHTKPTVKGARNAIVLTNFNEIWSEHVTSMNEYVAFTLPLEDFYKVYNYTNKSSEDSDKSGVIPAIENAYGKAASKAIDQLLTDLNGGTRTDSREGMGKALTGAFKKAKVMLSLSVVVQQPSSIIRAQAVIDPKYFVGKSDGKKHKEAWAELKKYAPVAIIKEMGYFDVGMGQTSAKWLMNEPDFMDKVDEITSWGAAKADEMTWIAIWNAVKRETLHTHKDLAPNSEAFLEAAGKRFEEIIRLTQVYDSTLSRSANMRSKSAFMQMATAFLAEPTTSLNMREMALRSGDKARIARTTAAVYASSLLNAILVALPYAMRDDDEDETFAEKYLSALTSSFVNNINPLTSIPFIKDIWSLAQGYSVGRTDMSLIDDFMNSMERLVKESVKDESDPKAIANAIVSLVGDFANFTGIPLKNLIREVKSIINFGKTISREINGMETTWNSIGDALEESFREETPIVGWLPKETKKEKIVEAIQKGDEAYVERFKSSYKDEDSFYSAIRSEVGELYRKGEITSRDATNLLVEYGGYEEDAENEAYWLIKEWDYKKKYGKDAEYSKYTEWYEAVKTGRNIKTVINDYTAHGVDKKTLASQITKYYKPIYVGMSNSERARLKGYLLNAYSLLGYNRSEKSRDIDTWLKD
jgi:hypothetical protein